MSDERARPSFIVFDLDGTLADSQEGILHCFHATMGERGRRVSDERLRGLIGPPLDDSFASLGLALDEIDDAVARYREHYARDGVDRCRLYPGVAELLGSLRDRDVTLAVATAKRVDFAHRVLERLGVASCFSLVRGAGLDGSLRTKREIVGSALGELDGVATRAGWMVGDRREDMGAARWHGLGAVGALWGYGSRHELLESGAQLLATSPSDLGDLVAGPPGGRSRLFPTS
jgi:phosphoglycolate phosphatase